VTSGASNQRAPRRLTTPRVAVVAALLAALVGFLVVAMLWLGGPATSGGNGLRLEVYDHAQERVVHTRAVQPGERFEVRHHHSVTRRLVVETFSVSAEGVAIEELWFDEPGPNLPVGPEEIGGVATTFLFEDGAFRVLHHGRLLPTLPLRVGAPGVDHVLTFADGTQLELLDIAAPATFVELRVTTGGGG
jgi:hypothetical protein